MSGEEIPCDDAGDANDSGGTDLSDAVFLVNFPFAGTEPPPPSPGPDACGSDPSQDALGYEDSSCP